MGKPLTINIELGEDGRSYRTGDFLNALDELVCYFTKQDKISDEEMIRALKLYTADMESWQ